VYVYILLGKGEGWRIVEQGSKKEKQTDGWIDGGMFWPQLNRPIRGAETEHVSKPRRLLGVTTPKTDV